MSTTISIVIPAYNSVSMFIGALIAWILEKRTPEFARELAAMKLDAVVTTCTPTTRAAQRALGSTPIVMAAVADPVGQHLIASLARPGANTTGLSSQAEDIMPKMLELFASVLPRPTTVAVLIDAMSNVHPRMSAFVVVQQSSNK